MAPPPAPRRRGRAPLSTARPPRFAADADLAYRAQAFRFTPGRALRLDPVYCARQLPLVAPSHPDVVPSAGEYLMGRYARPRASLAFFVDGEGLLAEPAVRALVARLRAAEGGRKVAWPLLARRRRVLHATACPGLDPERPGAEAAGAARALAAVPAFRIRLGGPWLGERFNVGRVYLPVYRKSAAGRTPLPRSSSGWAARRAGSTRSGS